VMNIQGVVIEHLVDSDFVPGVHEAYAFSIEGIPDNRIGSVLMEQLKDVDWDEVEKILAEIKGEEIGIGVGVDFAHEVTIDAHQVLAERRGELCLRSIDLLARECGVSEEDSAGYEVVATLRRAS